MNISSQAPALKMVQFQHVFFSTNADGFFRQDGADRRPVYVINLGNQTGVVSFQSIKQTLALGDNGEDEAMLDAVAEALKFVGDLRIGDALPNEVVNGEASWEPESHHLKTANKRIVAAMVKWSESSNAAITEPHEVRRFLAEDVDREKIACALRRLENAIGCDSQGQSQIQPVLMGLAKELSYVEALRETVARVRKIGSLLEHIRAAGGGQANDTQKASAVLRVFNHMMGLFDDKLASVDHHIVDMFTGVSGHEAVSGHIRQVRDQLRCELIAWEEPLTQWDGVTAKNIDVTETASKVSDLYRLLAPLYAPVDEWQQLKRDHQNIDPD